MPFSSGLVVGVSAPCHEDKDMNVNGGVMTKDGGKIKRRYYSIGQQCYAPGCLLLVARALAAGTRPVECGEPAFEPRRMGWQYAPYGLTDVRSLPVTV
jgi:hypothetical protein